MVGVINSLILITLSFLCCIGCSPARKSSEQLNQILELHNLQKKYHFEKLAEELVDQFSENFVSVSNGEITKLSREQNVTKFKNYFQSVEFEKWDDIVPPVVRFSDDHRTAYTIVNKIVIINYQNENMDTIRESTEFSWTTIYRYYPEGWKIDCLTSTNKSSVSELINSD